MEADVAELTQLLEALRLTTDTRPLRLRLALATGITDDLLLPQHVTGEEAWCGGLNLRVLCVSDDASLELKQFIAAPACLQVVTDRGELRPFSGIVVQASAGQSDGGLATYELVIRDAFAVFEQRTNTRVFRSLNELDILQRMIDEWRNRSALIAECLQLEIDPSAQTMELPAREFTLQYNESDAAFLSRLLRRRGLSWFMRSEDAATPRHTLVVIGPDALLEQNVAGTIRYHRSASTEERDSVTAWNACRQLRPASVTRFSWNYLDPAGTAFMASVAPGQVDQGELGNRLAAGLDDYLTQAPHVAKDYGDQNLLSELAAARHDFESKSFVGEACVRDMRVGQWVQIDGHAELDRHPEGERRFVVLWQRIEADSNLPKDLDARVRRLFALNGWTPSATTTSRGYRCQFRCVRLGVRLVPTFDARRDVPQVQPLNALVVGPAGEEVHCDRLGRIKLRFPATRPDDHDHANGSGASDSDADSAWVRVASGWAGNGPGSGQQCGSLGLPRVGSEVLVAFMGGDPDKPVVIGQMYNGDAHPIGLGAATGLPANRYLAGIKSREVGGARANALQLDDTPGEIGAVLRSDHASSELSLGWLGTPRATGTSDARGEGAELRTNRAAAIRGATGVLISACDNGGGEHLKREELQSLIDGLDALRHALTKNALTCQAGKPDDKALDELGTKLGKLGEVSMVALSAPAGMVQGSPGSLMLASGADIGLVSEDDTTISSGAAQHFLAKQDINLFSNDGNLNFVASAGKLELQAQHNRIDLVAKQAIEFTSNDDYITLRARKGVRILGDGGELLIDANGIQGFTPKQFQMHAGEHRFEPAEERPAQFPGELPHYDICVACEQSAATANLPLVSNN